MKNVALLCGVAALALASSGGIARADVTAEQVWDDWRALFAGSGGTLSTTGESRSGNTLTVTGLTLTLEMPEGSSVATIDRTTLEIRHSFEHQWYGETRAATVHATQVKRNPVMCRHPGRVACPEIGKPDEEDNDADLYRLKLIVQPVLGQENIVLNLVYHADVLVDQGADFLDTAFNGGQVLGQCLQIVADGAQVVAGRA